MDIGKRIERLGMKVFGICTALLGGIILVQLPSAYEEDVDFQSKAALTNKSPYLSPQLIQKSNG